jgi:tetratricopeptide (TPR) repeat protein
MKKLILIAMISFSGCFEVNAQINERYLSVMKKNVAIFDTATQKETFQTLLHSFERIVKIEKKEWLPNYYVALCASSIADREKDNNISEELTDKAEAYIAIADSLSPNNSEVYVVKAQIAFTQIKVDEVERGMKNTMIASRYLSKALKLDSQNPRVHILIGMGKLSMPENVGGNKKVACEYFRQAEILIKKQSKDEISPQWGNDTLKQALAICNRIIKITQGN